MDLVELLNKLLADTFVLYLKTQSFHWNVEGANFKQYHDLFGSLYEEVYAGIDPTAEQIRQMDGYAAGTMKRYLELSSIKETVQVLPPRDMFNDWMRANDEVMKQLKICNDNAERQGELGLANFLQGRMESHKKLAWMVRATLKVRSTDE